MAGSIQRFELGYLTMASSLLRSKLTEAGIFLLIILVVISFFVGAAIYGYDPSQLFLQAATWLLFGSVSLAVLFLGFATLANILGWLFRSR